MKVMPVKPAARAKRMAPAAGRPSWELVALFPSQGEWSDEDYLRLTDGLDPGRRVELAAGHIEVLPVPTEAHQLINGLLYRILSAFVEAGGLGVVVIAGLRVRLRVGTFRQPDVVYLSRENGTRRGKRFWTGADLAMEVVSDDDPPRDHETKRAEYAKAGIREYWVVDPRDRTVTLYLLRVRTYQKRGVFRDGDRVGSVVLPGLAADVTAVFDAADA